jgi:hypothetical protein
MISQASGAPAWSLRIVGLFDRPVFVGLLTVIGAVAFVCLRVAVVAHGDISRFIDVGSDFADRAQVPRGVTVVRGSGYDGQFYYRLALDPANLHRRASGITLDTYARVQRIMYSVLAWLGALGQRRLVPYSLVGVNVAALGGLGWLSGIMARDSGRRAAWGLLIVGYFGFLFSLGRDLTEICEACFVVAGLVALRRSHPLIAGLALAAAVLSRETALAVVGAVAVVAVLDIVRKKRGPGVQDAAWVLPIVVYAGWQVTGRAVTGTWPLRADAGDNLTLPFVAMVRAIAHYLVLLPSSHALIWLGEFAVLLVVAILAGWSLRVARVPVCEKVAWAISTVVVVCLTKGIWEGHADFRGFEDVYVLSAIVLLGSNRRLRIVAVIVAIAWVVTFVHRVAFL